MLQYYDLTINQITLCLSVTYLKTAFKNPLGHLPHQPHPGESVLGFVSTRTDTLC